MNRETLSFTLSTEDQCNYELVEQNHGVVCILPHMSLVHPAIPPSMFQEIIDHLIKLNRDYIRKVYFDQIKITYKFVSFKLSGHIRPAFREELKKPLDYKVLIDKKDDYNWVEADFFPRFPDGFEQEINNIEKRIKNMYWAFKKGKVKNIPYKLPDKYEIKYNYFFELDPTDIKPVFDIYVNTTTPETSGDTEDVSQMLRGKFNSLDVKLIFRDE